MIDDHRYLTQGAWGLFSPSQQSRVGSEARPQEFLAPLIDHCYLTLVSLTQSHS